MNLVLERSVLEARLDVVRSEQQTLLQQHARLTELVGQTLARLNQSQGRMAELTDLLALEEAPT